MDTFRARFAPSPTGPIHIGNIRTALFNYLFINNKQDQGSFILRIEDTDFERSSKEYEGYILQELLWLGMDWDEGPDKERDFGPYRQSERLELYQEYGKKLIEKGDAFKCYCTPEELEEQREILKAKGEMPKYIGNCYHLTTEDQEKLEGEGRPFVVRYRVPSNETVVFKDLIKGEISVNTDTIGDFVIIKSDGVPTYNYACVIDDYLMKITHVIRGEDHISNTPKQIILYNSLGLEMPHFAHTSMILGTDRTKLSKRHGDNYIGQYRDKGYLPEAMFNFLALLGWSPEGEEEILTKEEIISQFSLDKVVKSPAVFDIDKLNWMNSVYIKKADNERLLKLAENHFTEAGYIDGINEGNREKLLNIIGVIKGSLSYLEQIKDKAKIFFGEKVLPLTEEGKTILEMEHIKDLLTAFAVKVRDANTLEGEFTNDTFKELKNEFGVSGKKLFMPIRVALTGEVHGPDLPLIVPILGKDKILDQIQHVLNNI